ncbi:MAG: hypothetical protein HY854_07685 [Burkholderiales bacterium]|nr:hypothetical protein [Burkholderiales bacterium]
MKKDKQPRRASKKDVPLAKLQPRSAMNTRASGGDKESNEPLRKPLKSSTR